MREKLTAHQKAFALNLDSNRYGTVAGTIAKSMSAYDMAVSDAIYGSSTRYVSRERRVLRMLEYECGLLSEELVPDPVAELIKERKLLRYREPS